MKKPWLCGLLLLAASRVWAGSYDACYNPADIKTAGGLVTIAAPVFAGGTIPLQFGPINCDLITAPVLGTMFMTGSLLAGLRYAGVIDTMVGTLELRIYGGDKLVLAGVTKRGIGQSYDLAVVGVNGLLAGNVAELVNLDPSGSAFEIIY